jgi:uncharacterized membrane protein
MMHHGKALGVDVLLVLLSQQLALGVGIETQPQQAISMAFALYSLLAVVQAGYNTVRFVQHTRLDILQK